VRIVCVVAQVKLRRVALLGAVAAGNKDEWGLVKV
jgi:hypothetical protein